jgi:hypothetical protein
MVKIGGRAAGRSCIVPDGVFRAVFREIYDISRWSRLPFPAQGGKRRLEFRTREISLVVRHGCVSAGAVHSPDIFRQAWNGDLFPVPWPRQIRFNRPERLDLPDRFFLRSFCFGSGLVFVCLSPTAQPVEKIVDRMKPAASPPVSAFLSTAAKRDRSDACLAARPLAAFPSIARRDARLRLVEFQEVERRGAARPPGLGKERNVIARSASLRP